MEIEKVKAKIIKLLALGAADSGATEPERERALAQANKFILKYNLDADECVKTETPVEIIHTTMDFGKHHYVRTIVSAISQLYFCENLVFRNSPKHVIIGRPVNVQTVIQIIPYVLNSIRDEFYLYRNYTGLTPNRDDFYNGAARGVFQKCTELRRANEAMPQGNGKELVVASMYEQRRLENNAYVRKTLGPVSTGKAPTKNRDYSSYSAGMAVGLAAQVTVNLK